MKYIFITLFLGFTSFNCMAGLNVTIYPVNIPCYGQATGSATAVVYGDTTSVYLWNNGATTSNISGLIAGTYTVTVTSGGGVSATASGVVSAPSAALIPTVTVTQSNCSESSGSATVSATGGNSGYTYTWSNAITGTINNGIPAGTYAVTVTDQQGCSATASGVVTNPPAPVISISVTNPSCHNDSSGKMVANVTAGTAPYTFMWSNGATGASVTRIRGPLTLSLLVTDQKNCGFTMTGSVTDPDALGLADYNISPVYNSFLNNGQISITPGGGVPPYTESWSTGAVNETVISDLGVGQYSLVLRDSNHCAVAFNFNVPLATAINETTADGDLKLFPNPANTQVNISTVTGQYKLIITDVQGKQMFIAQNICTGQQLIQTSQWPVGVYTAAITAGKNVWVRQFTVIH